ncbi:MAG TPA: hypothetical protein VJX67_13880, partial [Blastocatellia bacterium]|nr:hypothetical protein [Blastocatellia bacterium]
MNETTNQSIATTGATTGGNVAAQKAMQDNWLKTPIRAVSEFAGRLKQVEQLGFLCNPFTPTAIPESYSLSEQIVMIHPEESEREVYKGFFCKGDYVALTKIGVLKIFRALGASVVFSSRTDDRRDPHYCAWSVMVRIRDVTGRWIDYPGSKEIDLRYKGADWQNVRKQAVDDQGEFEEGKFKRLVNQARQNIQSNAETKALLRAVRGIGGIRPAYKKEDLATKPFYCYRLQFEPDMSDQRVKELVTAAEFGVVGQLWGGARDSSGGLARPGVARSSAPSEIRPTDWQMEGEDGGGGDFHEIGEPPVNQASANQ